jgi:hypothetical protein
MQKLLLVTVCVIVLTIGAQAKPIQLGLINNRWVIEYDSELFAACIATRGYDLLKLKISFLLLLLIQRKGQKNFGYLVFLVRSGLGLRAAQLMILPLIPKGKPVKQKIGPLFLL